MHQTDLQNNTVQFSDQTTPGILQLLLMKGLVSTSIPMSLKGFFDTNGWGPQGPAAALCHAVGPIAGNSDLIYPQVLSSKEKVA